MLFWGKKKAYSPRWIEEEEEKNGITPIAGISPSVATAGQELPFCILQLDCSGRTGSRLRDLASEFHRSHSRFNPPPPPRCSPPAGGSSTSRSGLEACGFSRRHPRGTGPGGQSFVAKTTLSRSTRPNHLELLSVSLARLVQLISSTRLLPARSTVARLLSPSRFQPLDKSTVSCLF